MPTNQKIRWLICLLIGVIFKGIDVSCASSPYGSLRQRGERAVFQHLPLFCQAGNETVIQEAGFEDVRPLSDLVVWNGITIRRTKGSARRRRNGADYGQSLRICV